jgi:hypothetical protein
VDLLEALRRTWGRDDGWTPGDNAFGLTVSRVPMVNEPSREMSLLVAAPPPAPRNLREFMKSEEFNKRVWELRPTRQPVVEKTRETG